MGLDALCNRHFVLLVAKLEGVLKVLAGVTALHLLILRKNVIVIKVIFEAEGFTLSILRKVRIIPVRISLLIDLILLLQHFE